MANIVPILLHLLFLLPGQQDQDQQDQDQDQQDQDQQDQALLDQDIVTLAEFISLHFSNIMILASAHPSQSMLPLLIQLATSNGEHTYDATFNGVRNYVSRSMGVALWQRCTTI